MQDLLRLLAHSCISTAYKSETHTPHKAGKTTPHTMLIVGIEFRTSQFGELNRVKLWTYFLL